MIQIYHNNRCSKSRETLNILQERGEKIEVIEYLKTPPTENDLREILKKLNMKPEQLLRKSESVFKENFAGKNYSDDEWIKIMADNPVLIERPIVINNNQAVIGRPPEKVLDIV